MPEGHWPVWARGPGTSHDDDEFLLVADRGVGTLARTGSPGRAPRWHRPGAACTQVAGPH